MGTVKEYLKSAINQMKHNGYRTFMTMLGIIIGIAAVITVVSLGKGMTDYVNGEINGIVGNYGYVVIDNAKTTELFTPDDIRLLEESVSDLKGVSPYFDETTARAKGPRGTYQADVIGGTEAVELAVSSKVYKGQYFTRQMVETGQKVCIMMKNDAKHLFGTEECLGNVVEITIAGKTAEYTVIGLREDINSEMINTFAGDMDYYVTIETPYTAFASDFGYDIDKLNMFLIFADQDVLQKKVKECAQVLENAHGLRGANALWSYSMADMSEEINTVLGGASTFLIWVAVISLVVGGIGIMNIMLVSVTERTREIGIRKSIGARTGAITAQFLSEAAVLTLSGGAIGIIVGIGLSFVVCSLLHFKLIITPGSVLGATLISVGIGLGFGIYPARKAAKMKPIDALRV